MSLRLALRVHTHGTAGAASLDQVFAQVQRRPCAPPWLDSPRLAPFLLSSTATPEAGDPEALGVSSQCILAVPCTMPREWVEIPIRNFSGLDIVEVTLRFDTLRGKKDEPTRVPEMKSLCVHLGAFFIRFG